MQLVCELLIISHSMPFSFSLSSSSFSSTQQLYLFSHYLISFTTQLEPHTLLLLNVHLSHLLTRYGYEHVNYTFWFVQNLYTKILWEYHDTTFYSYLTRDASLRNF